MATTIAPPSSFRPPWAGLPPPAPFPRPRADPCNPVLRCGRGNGHIYPIQTNPSIYIQRMHAFARRRASGSDSHPSGPTQRIPRPASHGERGEKVTRTTVRNPNRTPRAITVL
ncbi:uncharacterized protein EI97DRAFT_437932 [Westerdykella ornata]|uniref:Uncharacterized protein n=1 Tax=Westerdykella ornata TaxID=318751 RepID=A0A6A6J4H6_WESOR|nr:uncharacterized protein EI97DRAFT_437932 [Westerdykella ornata]KAF2271345.1 hypothetical protein EI97DRAFT_437932 [Westerdykella ornata]